MTEKKLRKLEADCYKNLNLLTSSLEILANACSEILGVEVSADICSGSEIELRTEDRCGRPDDGVCIRIEEVIDKLNQKEK
jgi:hypothetical protein